MSRLPETRLPDTPPKAPPKDKVPSCGPPILPMPPRLPTIDIFLDPSVVPSLPPPGESLDYASLVRGRFVTPPAATYEVRQAGGGQLSPGDVIVGGSWSAGDSRPSFLSRYSSWEAGKAGVGCARGIVPSPRRGKEGQQSQIGDGGVKTGGSAPGLLEPPQPGKIRRTSSFKDRLVVPPSRSGTVPIPKPGPVRGRISGGHQRTASDSTAGSTLTPKHASLSGAPTKHSRSGSGHGVPPILVAGDECIRLGTDRDLPTTSKVLLTLHALTPPKRTPLHAIPPPTSGLLHPATLLTPLAIVLEALVVERSVLRNEPPSSRLPPLRDGSKLQLEYGDGELDWNVMRPYVLAIGQVLSQVVPHLQSAAAKKGQGGDVEGVTRGVRMYVSKQKKVFGQVASMYVEGYGCMKGWWDESGMKACAGEVGRWSDVFDA